MYIAYSIKKGNEYATLTSSVRDGAKVVKGESINLGRVLDKERGIFRNRERGVFTYDIRRELPSTLLPFSLCNC